MRSESTKPVRVGLVQVSNNYADSVYFPYSVGLLQAYAQKNLKYPEKYVFLDIIFRRMPINQIVSRLKDACIVAFSTYIWNFEISLEIARRLKKENNDILTIFGGCHIPDRSERVLRDHPFIDITCHGEGEKTFTAILEKLQSKNWNEIPSISYLERGTYVKAPLIPRNKDLSIIPSPYLDGTFDCLMKDNPKFKWMALWETNRGCPFTCAYCDWGSMTKAQLYEFSMDRLLLEIEWFARHHVEFIYCCDANFGILKRDITIARTIAAAKTKYGYPKSFSVHDTKNASERTYAIQKCLSDTNLSKGVSLALQSTDVDTLTNIGRKNISLKSFMKLQKQFNSYQIETYTDLIIALPGETYTSFTKGVSDIIEMGQHNRIRMGNLSVLPNSEMGNPEYQKRHGLMIVNVKNVAQHTSVNNTEDDVNEIHRIVVATHTMPKEDWIRTKVYAWWCSFLYCGKLLQIPILLLHELCSSRYDDIFKLFINADRTKYPLLASITEYYYEQARKIQKSGIESHHVPEWLDLHWPQDEYIFIKCVYENSIEMFYKESEQILFDNILYSNRSAPFLHDAVMLNMHLLKQPFITEDADIKLDYNIWEFYKSTIECQNIALMHDKFRYLIDRTSEKWTSWDDWFREVVWYGNKKGAYLYSVKLLPG